VGPNGNYPFKRVPILNGKSGTLTFWMGKKGPKGRSSKKNFPPFGNLPIGGKESLGGPKGGKKPGTPHPHREGLYPGRNGETLFIGRGKTQTPGG